MRLWIDDNKPAPEGSVWAMSANFAIYTIEWWEKFYHQYDTDNTIYIDIDYNSQLSWRDGGDFISVLTWMEETGRSYPVRIHSISPSGRKRMQEIIERNGWESYD